MNITQILKELDTLNHTQVEAFLQEKIAQAETQQNYEIQISLLNELIGFCRDTCQHEKNAQNVAKLLALLESQGLQGSKAYATSLLNIANACRAAGQLEESLAYYKEVHHLYEKQLPPGDFLFASLNNNMALLYQEMNDYENACHCLKKALEIVKKTPDAVIETATTHTNLAQSLLRLNRMEEAMEHLDKAFAIFKQDGNRDYHYSATLAVYAEAKYKQAEYQLSAEYYEKAMQEFEKHMGRGGNYELLKQNREDALARLAENSGENAHKDAVSIENKQSATEKVTADGKANQSTLSHTPASSFIAGLALCESFYETCGRPMLHSQFAEYENQIAVGLAGEGSDCFGFDDEVSRDHDWGPGFCMWLSDDVYEKIGEKLQQAYDGLPTEYRGYQRMVTREGAHRMGVFRIHAFYHHILGNGFTPDSIDWEQIPEDALATAVNGRVFADPQGSFSEIRTKLLSYYPDKVWKRKLGQELILMAKAGQYNYDRMGKRGDLVTAQIFLGQYMEHTLRTLFLLNRTYAPYAKWLQKGASGLTILPEITDILRAIADMPINDEKISMTIEIVAQLLVKELTKQGLIHEPLEKQDTYYLEPYGRRLLSESMTENISKQELHNQLIDQLVLTEWKAFDQVKNEGGRASCQDDWNTFSIMRKSQYMEWSNEMMESYLNDFDEAAKRGWNLITEKYGRMMESTTPDHYEAIKDSFPVLPERKKAIIEEIVKIQVGFMEELAAKYPKVADTARSIHTSEDTPYNTSYETYLRGELGTYSDETLSLYGAFIVGIVHRGENLAVNIMRNTAVLYGYGSLKELESRLE